MEIPITTADFCFPVQPRPLVVFVDGRVHLRMTQSARDEELRSFLRKRGYGILGLLYKRYTDEEGDQLYDEIFDQPRKVV